MNTAEEPPRTPEKPPDEPLLLRRPTSLRKHKSRHDRAFLRILLAVLVVHVIALLSLYFSGRLNNYVPREIQINISPPPPAVKPPPPLPEPPIGELKPHEPVKVRHAPQPAPQPASHTRTVATKAAPGETGDIASTPPDVPIDGPSPDVDTRDVRDIAGAVSAPGPAAAGEAPAGFANGKINGRVYFIRLKHDIGNWYAHEEGVSALLAFMNRYFQCETENRPMTAEEIQQKYIAKGAIPSFLYVSCDGNFSLTSEEATILRGYVERGGFLFLDSAPDELTRGVVAEQLAKVVPSGRLAQISPAHPINRFLFRLAQPGVGENWSDAHNYGITLGDRFAVFYTPGNLAHYYELSRDKSDDYSTAQFQMGANVVAYAINKGVQSAVQQRPGARGTITRSTLQDLGFLDKPRTTPDGNPPAKSPPKTQKVAPGAKPGEEQPADIKIVD
jgi:hypothetical protein